MTKLTVNKGDTVKVGSTLVEIETKEDETKQKRSEDKGQAEQKQKKSDDEKNAASKDQAEKVDKNVKGKINEGEECEERESTPEKMAAKDKKDESEDNRDGPVDTGRAETSAEDQKRRRGGEAMTGMGTLTTTTVRSA